MENKTLRLKRIFHNNNRILALPIDHGVTYGMLPGIDRYMDLVNSVKDAGIDVLIAHKGILKRLIDIDGIENLSLFQHISGATNFVDSANKVLVGSVEEAVRTGMTGVSMHVTLNHPEEKRMLQDLGAVSEACQRWGMPLLAMMYVKDKENCLEAVAHSIRLAEELGADIVKVSQPKKLDGFSEIIAKTNIKVLVSGGELKENANTFLTSKIIPALKCGISGCAIGRNIFEQENPHDFCAQISETIHKM